jgi:hypothetical protein
MTRCVSRCSSLLPCNYGDGSELRSHRGQKHATGGTSLTHHILAIYDNPKEASLAVDRLVANGIAEQAISIVASEGYRSEYLGIKGSTKGAEGVATGATIGGILGAVAAALVATGTVIASGGTLLVAGPIAAALAGAGAGGATGGILGGLVGLGVPDVHVKAYDKAVGNSSGMLLGFEINDTNKAQVKDILKATGGKSISTE